EFKAGVLGLGVGLTGQEAELLARAVDGEDTGLVDRGRFEAAATQDWGRSSGGCERPTSAPAPVVATPDASRCDGEAAPLPGECGNNQGAFCRPAEKEKQEVESRRRAIDIISGIRDGEKGYCCADGEEQLPPPAPPPPPPRRSNQVPPPRSEP
ncbi:unnamed protein product, partial [Pylaiella littoralis]